MALPAGIRALLLDVEGTTTPIDFVAGTLFPYAAKAISGGYLAHSSTHEAVRASLDVLAAEQARELAQGADLPPFGDGAAYALALMREDRKSPGLKGLQGLIWQEGYQRGELKGEVFPDVPPVLAAWSAAGLRMRVFSSGSVLAQKLLFSTTPEGDLTPFFEGHHDTTTGAKHAPGSYAAIASAFGLPPESILFLSDSVAELTAAAEAGLEVRLAERPGNPPVGAHRFQTVGSFDDLR